MSRNLGRTGCYYCPSVVKLTEPPRPVTKEETGAFWREYEGMTVANAECPACLAQYLAWVDPPKHPSWGSMGRDRTGTHFDLSFRHSFNDEPDEHDQPRYDVKMQLVRTGPWTGKPYLRLGVVKE